MTVLLRHTLWEFQTICHSAWKADRHEYHPVIGFPDPSGPCMSPKASKELKIILWIFAGSFFLMPAVLWFVVVGILKRDFSFREDYFDFYQDLFSLQPDMIFAWLMLLVPVVIYEVSVTCYHYYRHPEQMRSIFQFIRKDRK